MWTDEVRLRIVGSRLRIILSTMQYAGLNHDTADVTRPEVKDIEDRTPVRSQIEYEHVRQLTLNADSATKRECFPDVPVCYRRLPVTQS